MSILQISNDKGVPFTVRRVMPGDRYGLNARLVHDKDEPLIEFYDARHTQESELGQFVSRYYESTLIHKHGRHTTGLCLDGRVPAWNLDADSMAQVMGWVSEGAMEDQAPSHQGARPRG